MDESQKHAKWKKPDTKDYILYDYIYMRFPGKENLEMESRLVVAWGWRLQTGISDLFGWWKYSKTVLCWWLYNSINFF